MSSSPPSDPTAPGPAPVDVVVGARFDDFYRAQYPPLARLLWAITGRWAIAEELTQEALLAAHRSWPRVVALERPDLWVRRVAVNRAISAHRRLLTEAAVLARLPQTTTPPIEPPDDRDVWAAVRRLPRRQAAALVLTAADGLTFDEAGEVLGCSGETARTHARRARQRLRELLTDRRRQEEP